MPLAYSNLSIIIICFPGGPAVKNPPADAGDQGSIPGWERTLGEGNGNLLQNFCLGNPMDRGAWWAAYHLSGHKRIRLATKQQQQIMITAETIKKLHGKWEGNPKKRRYVYMNG